MTTLPSVRARAIHPARLRLARMLRGFNQAELARQVGVSASAISQFEGGAAVPSDHTLERLTVALGCSPEFFSRPWQELALSKPFFRRLRSCPQQERDRAEAYAYAIAEVVELLEQYVQLPQPRFDFGCGLSWVDITPKQIEEAALRVRAVWEIPPGPIANVVRLLEARGAVVAAVGAFDPSLDAFSMRTRRRPVIVLCSEKGAAARRRFDAAHELGHLVLHDHPADATKPQEKQAHRFASAFLMPAAEVEPWLVTRSNQLELLEEGSRIWGVSMQALLFRARDLGTLSEHAYQRTMRRMSARGWRTREPIEIGPIEKPELLARVAETLPHAGTSLAAISDRFGVPRARLARMLRLPEDHDETFGGKVVPIAGTASG